MTKVFEAFESISDEYILDALTYCEQKKRNLRFIIGAFAACLVLFVSCYIVHFFVQPPSSGGIETPAKIYSIGETVIVCNTIEVNYTEVTDTTVRFTIVNPNEYDKEVEARFDAYKYVSKNRRYMYRTSTDPDFKRFDMWQAIPGVLKMYIDGVEVDRLIIPGDNATHEVIIDYSYFVENGYVMSNIWELEATNFFLYNSHN